MKHLLLLALTAAAAVATGILPVMLEEEITESIFRPGVEYVYRYESEALTGIRTVSDQLSGLKVRCKVKVQFHRDGTTLLKMQDVHVYKINNGVSRVHRFETVPEHQLTRFTGEEAEVMIEQLVKPIKFRMTEGEVRDVQTDETDEYWSINIKKGLLSLLQVKISGQSTISDSESFLSQPSSRQRNLFYDTMSPVGRRSRLATSRPMDNIFKVMELDVNGECETKYVINSEEPQDISSVSNMVVTKVKNFDKCLTRNSFEQGLFAGLPHFPSEKKLIQPSMEAEYVLSGDRHHFLIRKAKLEAKYIFTPYGQEGGQISSHIVQKLQLLKTEEISTPISSASFKTERLGLKMEVPSAQWLEESSVPNRQQQQQPTEFEYKQLIEKWLTQLLSFIYPTMREPSTATLVQLTLVVRDVPRHHLKSIIKSYIQSSDELNQKKSEILLDILPTIQSPDVAKVLIDLIRDETIRGVRSRLSIGAMSLTVKPTPEILQSLVALYKEGGSLERHTPMLRQTILLSVGTICNKMINTMRRHNKPIPQLLSAVEEVSAELINMLERSESESEKILVLKSMGNSGAKELIMPIKSVIDEKSQPLVVRTQAVFALRKIAKSFQKLVHPILLTVVLDKQEAKQVRASALMVLKDSQPSLTTLQLLAHSLRTEPCRQIKTLLYSTLVNLASVKQHVPEIRETSKNARKVLKLIRAIPVGIIDSKEIRVHADCEDTKLGAEADLWFLRSEMTGLPKNVVGKKRVTIFGNTIELMSGGIESRGLDTILRRLFGPYGLLKDVINSRLTVNDLLRPLSGQHFEVMAEKIREFIGRRAFEPRMEEEIKGLMFGEILGQELAYAQFDKELVERLMELAVRTGPQLINKLKEGINVDTLKTLSSTVNSLSLPTPMGVPLILNVTAAAVFKLEGLVKANSLPELSHFVLRRPYMTRKIELISDIKPSVNMGVLGSMAFHMRWIVSGSGIHAELMGSLPIKGEIIVDPSDSKVAIKFDPPTHPVQLITTKIEPANFMVYSPKSLHKLPYEYEMKTLYSRENARSFAVEKNVPVPVINSAFDVKLQWTKCMTSWCAYEPLTGKQQVSVIYQPLEMSSTKEIELKIHTFSQDMYEEEGVENEFLPTSRNYRLERRGLINIEEFLPVEMENVLSTPRKVELLMELKLRGFRSEKRVQTKVTWTAEENYLEHQLNVQVVGIENEDIPKFKLMLNGMMRCPVTIESLSYYVRSGEVLGKLDMFYGRNSFRENVVKSKLFKVSESQWMSELQQEGIEHSLPNDYLESVTPKVFNYGVEVELPRLNSYAQKYLTYVLDIIKMISYKHLKVAIPETIPQNKIVVLGQYVTKLEKLSVIIKTPRETDFILDLPLSNKWLSYSLPSLHDVNPMTYYTNFSRLSMEELELPEFDSYSTFDTQFTPSCSGICKVHSDKVLTFDGVPIILPRFTSQTSSSRCNVLIAQDCSQRGLFSVKGSFKFGRWSVKMVVPSYELELTPESSSFDSVVLLVNGQPTRLSTSVPVQLPSLISSSSEPVVIEKVIGEGVKVKLAELGLTVVLSPTDKIFIKMSPWSMLQGKLCGLCGNHNYDTSDDLKTLDSKIIASSRRFVMDNLLPSSSCDASDYETQLGLRHQGFCKKEKTLKLERTTGEVDEVCFSRNPITVCRRHCVPEITTPRSVSLVCLPRLSSTAQRLVAKYHSGQTLLTEEISSIPSSNIISRHVQQAEKCVSSL